MCASGSVGEREREGGEGNELFQPVGVVQRWDDGMSLTQRDFKMEITVKEEKEGDGSLNYPPLLTMEDVGRNGCSDGNLE